MELVDVKFSNLNLFIEEGIFRKTKKIILNDVSGEFRGGELTGILGQSGSGKTSLLNCISSYQTKNMTGSIKIPKKDFKLKYIMQDDLNFLSLTVYEAMEYSLKFKIGHATAEKYNEIIVSTLDCLAISHTVNNLIGSLSSGERRRLSIGLDLVDNPKIIFLDEPTTGLDSFSSVQCIKLLKKLAMEGRTIICTIHQPSTIILKMFDHIYALSSGRCIYQGSYENVLFFLNQINLVCPNIYNPVDFIMEFSDSVDFLVDHIRNGRNEQFRGNNNNQLGMIDYRNDAVIVNKLETSHTPSFFYRLRQLTRRTMLVMIRDKSNIKMRVLINLVVGLLIGILYNKIGNDANEILNEFKFIFILNGFCAYSGFYSLLVKFPLDFPLIKREYFNQNYSALTYHLAVFISDFPVTILCTCLYVCTAYFLTNQPMEAFRFFMVLSILISVSFAAQAYGMGIGSMFNLKISIIIAALLMATHILFSGFIVLQKDVHWTFKLVFEVIYLKHAFYATTRILESNRTLSCDKIYCHFQKPRKFMDMIGIDDDDDLITPLIAIMLTFFTLHFLTFLRLRFRLKN